MIDLLFKHLGEGRRQGRKPINIIIKIGQKPCVFDTFWQVKFKLSSSGRSWRPSLGQAGDRWADKQPRGLYRRWVDKVQGISALGRQATTRFKCGLKSSRYIGESAAFRGQASIYSNFRTGPAVTTANFETPLMEYRRFEVHYRPPTEGNKRPGNMNVSKDFCSPSDGISTF